MPSRRRPMTAGWPTMAGWVTTVGWPPPRADRHRQK
jgi:hypothetical protein